MEIVLDKVCYRNLKNINIKFKEGLINGVIGSNGSGKSSLLEVITTLSKVDKGMLKIDGISIDKTNPMINYDMIRFEIGYVLQNPENSLFCNTVEEQIKYNLQKYNYKNNKKRINESLKMVGLDEEYLNMDIDSLSSSEKFLISLASALALNPKVLILDEPCAHLDNYQQKELIKLLRTLKNRFHKTIIILSIDSNFIQSICDYIYVLGDNTVVLEGSKPEIFKQEKKLNKYNIDIPFTVLFENKVLEQKKIKMGYRDNINDLLKDIYFYKN